MIERPRTLTREVNEWIADCEEGQEYPLDSNFETLSVTFLYSPRTHFEKPNVEIICVKLDNKDITMERPTQAIMTKIEDDLYELMEREYH